ncbi:hypothetical protein BH23BAC3_BH23BAC3_12690 [soil metagenome]
MNALDKDPYQLRAIIKKNLMPFTIILSLGFIFYACNDSQNPVADAGDATIYSHQSQLLNKINEPVTIADYIVTFSRTYDQNEDQTTFSYNVNNANNVRPVANDFSLKLLDCQNVPVEITPDDEVNFTGELIIWNQAISASVNERDYSITYSGELSIGEAEATIKRGGFGETKTLPGPSCNTEIETYTISGYVYVDANENEIKNNNESGIGNVTVEVLDGNGIDVIYSQRTSNDGSYEFTVIGDNNYTVKVPDNTVDESDFNEQLFALFNATTDTSISLTVTEDKPDQNFGFLPDIDVITSKFSSGEIELDTKNFQYWRKQLLLAINSERTPGRGNRVQDIPAMDESTTDLLEYLEEIEENFLLPNIFNFGPNIDSKRLQAAYNILQPPARTIEQELCVELLTAELNIVSGRGSGTQELDLAIAAFGEFFAADGHCISSTNTSNGNMLMSNSVTETIPFTMTSSATTSSGTTLLRSFNGGGGGVGSK